MVPETVEPVLGAVADTVGGVVSVEGGGGGGAVLLTKPPQALRPIAKNNRKQVEMMPGLPAPGLWKGFLTVFLSPLMRSSRSLYFPTENSVSPAQGTTVQGDSLRTHRATVRASRLDSCHQTSSHPKRERNCKLRCHGKELRCPHPPSCSCQPPVSPASPSGLHRRRRTPLMLSIVKSALRLSRRPPPDHNALSLRRRRLPEKTDRPSRRT